MTIIVMDKNISGSAMIIGGGISAIQATLDLADSGYYVYNFKYY